MSDTQTFTRTILEGGALDLPLEHELDLILLRRRLRAIGDELNFDSRDIGRLSTAAYEGARHLFSAQGRAAAEIRLSSEGPRPTLRVTIRAQAGDVEQREEALRRLEVESGPLRVLVNRVSVDATPDGIALGLIATPAGGPAARADTGARVATAERTGLEMHDRDEQVQHALRDMQVELQETNRGMVALYAELDDQTARLRHAEDRLRTLLDSVQDYAICMLGPDGEIASWNIGAERLFLYAADEIVGRNYSCFFTPADRDEGLPADHLRSALEEGRHATEGLRVRRGGSAFDAHALITPVRNTNGSHRGFSLVVRDITERKRLEDDLRRRAEELESANRAKEEFLATLSHELRTPLNAMLGWTRLLRSGKLDGPAMARALETIERNAHVQEQLIADILDVSRIVTGKLRLELRPLDIAPIVRSVVDVLQPTADAKGVHLKAEVEDAGTVMGDPDRLQQVFWNLVSNAVKFTPRGGTVTVSSGRVGANAIVKVEDTGEGIGPELLPYVFDRFRQGDGSATRLHGGLGLGLAIVRHLVELHGGHVQAWSEGAAQGSTFAVGLPVRAVQRVGELERVPEASLNGLNVLVVDDDPDAREVVSLALAQCGARTAAVASAREAIRIMQQFSPDVVVSDIAMPGEDGYSLVRRIRTMTSESAEVPVIALTTFTQPEERRRAMGAGFHHFVPKPVEVDELAAVIRTVTQKR